MFSVGLILVVVAGAELFTGNMVIIIGALSSVLTKRSMLKNWSTVYLGNLIGSLAMAYLVYEAGLMGHQENLSALGVSAAKIADAKLALPFGAAFIRGIFCNILVVLAVIMAVMAKDIVSKVAVIIFPITCFVASGFEHCVANMYLIPIGFLSKGVPFSQWHLMFSNIIPVTLGNIAGGLFILMIHPNRIRQLRFLSARRK